jgi:syntaxin 7
MSFQDIEAGRAPPNPQFSSSSPSSSLGGHALQSREDATFQNLQSSLSMQVFKMNANVQGMLKLVDQLGTQRDSASLRKSLRVCIIYSTLVVANTFSLHRHDLTESTRAMAKRGSEDLKKLSVMQASLVRSLLGFPCSR